MDKAYIKCPHCHQPNVDDEALLCIYCGESLKRQVGFFGKFVSPKQTLIGFIIALLLAVSFFILIITH